MKYIYGPIRSRRLGFSLGISLTPRKTCSFDCVYCQLGKTTHRTAERKEYLKIEEVLEEIKQWVKENPEEVKKLDYMTFSGFGEPTLNTKFGQLILEIKKTAPVKVAVITNSTFISEPSVRKELLNADLIVPSLDAIEQDIFEKVDLPAEGIKIEDIIDGLIKLRKEYNGKIWLEVMFIKGINDETGQIKKIKAVIDRINPDKIQINSPIRKTKEQEISSLEKEKLEAIKRLFGDKAEII
ncbi:MAG: radical SAM protein [Candidatus Omnitrophota bacterium]